MEKSNYIHTEMKVIEFDTLDVIATSTVFTQTSLDDFEGGGY